MGKTLGDALNLVFALKNTANLLRNGLEFLDHALALAKGEMTNAAKVQGQQGQDRNLIGERLGAGHANLGTGMNVHAPIRFAGNAAANHIAQGQRGMAFAFGLPESCQRIGSLT